MSASPFCFIIMYKVPSGQREEGDEKEEQRKEKKPQPLRSDLPRSPQQKHKVVVVRDIGRHDLQTWAHEIRSLFLHPLEMSTNFARMRALVHLT